MTAIKPEGDEELRAELSSADTNDLPDSDFAYIEPGGEKDAEGKTTPRSLRHFPIQDKAHVQNALARLSQSPFGDKAKAKVVAAAKKFGIEVADDTQKNADGEESEIRAKCPTCKGSGTIMDGNRDCPDCDGSGKVDGEAADDASRASSATKVTRKRSRHRAVPLMPEVRFWHAEGIEMREQSNTNELWISGIPVVYDTPYTVVDALGSFSERMAPGVATDVLANGCDCRLLYNHDGLPLARTVNNRGVPPTMTLMDSPEGLRFEACLDLRQQLANDVAISLERGDSSQMSVGFRVGRDEWSDGWDQRTIYSFDSLLDVSIVTYPASESTSVDIMRRYADLVPVESAARIRKMYVDTRAGAKMSSKAQALIADAFMGLHSALQDSGAGLPEVSPMDPDGSVGQDGDAGNGETNADALTPVDGTESTVEPVGSDGPGEPQYMDDGSQGALSVGSEGYPGFADGSGLRKAPDSAEERAAASLSYGDQQSAVYQALMAKFDTSNPWNGPCDLWVQDCGPDWCVFESWGDPKGLWKIGYSLDDSGAVTFSGDPVQVSMQTQYVPVERDASVVAERVSVRSSNALRLALEARKRRR
jgi:HK97 family phage prohead protease